MASVHFGRLDGPSGFRRTVAVKRMLESYAANAQARAMLVDEARLSSRVNHPNVVQTLDVVETEGELFLVLEYVHGESLDRLLERSRQLSKRPSPKLALAIIAQVLRGLDAAHHARGEDGQPLELVHRDLSPHNVMVDVHGVARVLDFGVARARGRLQATHDGQLKGKLAYLAPEQVHGDASARSDLFAAGVVLWEALTAKQLFQGRSEAELLSNVLLCKVPPLSGEGLELPAVQAVLDRALAREPEQRYESAAQMADALEACGAAAASEVAAWLNELASESLEFRARRVAELEQTIPSPTGEGERLHRPFPWRPTALAFLAAATLGFMLWLFLPVTLPIPIPTAPPPAPTAPEPHTAHLAPLPPLEPTKPPPARVESHVPAHKPEPAAAPAAPKCDPPFVIDAQGVKRFKVECLH
jgi:serine/threonine-protein kinase